SAARWRRPRCHGPLSRASGADGEGGRQLAARAEAQLALGARKVELDGLDGHEQRPRALLVRELARAISGTRRSLGVRAWRPTSAAVAAETSAWPRSHAPASRRAGGLSPVWLPMRTGALRVSARAVAIVPSGRSKDASRASLSGSTCSPPSSATARELLADVLAREHTRIRDRSRPHSSQLET